MRAAAPARRGSVRRGAAEARAATGAGRSSRSCAISAGRYAFTAATSMQTGRLGTTTARRRGCGGRLRRHPGPFPGVSRAADLDLTAHADELVVKGAALAAPLSAWPSSARWTPRASRRNGKSRPDAARGAEGKVTTHDNVMLGPRRAVVAPRGTAPRGAPSPGTPSTQQYRRRGR